MSSYVISPFQGLPMTEVVPDAMEVEGVSKSSLLTGRRKIRFTPQNGTVANPGSIIQFVLADSTCLLDVNSMVISYTATTSGGTGGPFSFDDGPSWCRRSQISVNGQLLDDTDNAHRNANMNMYLNGDRSWYSGPGSFAGWWQLNNDIGNNYTSLNAARTVGATYVQADVNAALSTVPPRYGDVVANFANASARYAAGISQAVPLGLLSASLRCRQYWPLSQMGELVIQLTTAPASECLFAPGGTGSPTYQLSDIYLECDLISPHFMYQELLNKVTQMEDQHGLVVPVQTTIVTQGQQIPAGSQDSSIIVSRATNNLRSVNMVVVPAAGLQNLQWPSVSAFPCEAFNQVQFRIGSLNNMIESY